jgi:hypothetical protein
MAKDGPAPSSKKKRRTATLEPPPVDKLIMPAIVIGLAMLAYQFIKGISSEVRGREIASCAPATVWVVGLSSAGDVK